ncbi:hypothetical protein AN958_06543 [Leucoagaricus sp. SymC.cos]|nr:hypothetical protein AN958_06543 [Leucoagaricus sp. SymC.cos]
MCESIEQLCLFFIASAEEEVDSDEIQYWMIASVISGGICGTMTTSRTRVLGSQWYRAYSGDCR